MFSILVRVALRKSQVCVSPIPSKIFVFYKQNKYNAKTSLGRGDTHTGVFLEATPFGNRKL